MMKIIIFAPHTDDGDIGVIICQKGKSGPRGPTTFMNGPQRMTLSGLLSFKTTDKIGGSLFESYLSIKLALGEITSDEVKVYQDKSKYGRRMVRYMDQIFLN
jgi:hypothetical protein